MARPTRGSIVTRKLAGGDVSYAARVQTGGERHFVHLGYASDGMTPDRAADELAAIRAGITRGDWQPPVYEPEPERADPLFGEFAEDWFDGWRLTVGERTRTIVRGHLDVHLLPYFGPLRLSQLDARRIDGYTRHKLEEGRIQGATLNRTLFDLRRILDAAVRYELIARNPALGARVKVEARTRAYLDRPEQIAALLAAADQLDERARHGTHRDRRAIVTVLTFSGLRIGELLALRWQDVDLANGRLHVREAKTEAGTRTVNLLPIVAGELRGLKAARDPRPSALVFGTTAGTQDARGKVAARALDKPVERANDGRDVPLPRLTPHALRRTFATVLFMLGEDPLYVAAQMGHTDPSTTVRFYARVMAGVTLEERDRLRGELQSLVNGAPIGELWQRSGTKALGANPQPA